jgi:hypothetical protein
MTGQSKSARVSSLPDEENAAVRPKLIECWDELPRAQETHVQERLWFDLKETYSPKTLAEKAKDVAAFANSIGGALIIGAKEGPTAPDYSSPLSTEYASSIENEFDEAVRSFCRPSPTVHVRTIPVPGAQTKAILVVNVEPSIEQPVAARHQTDANFWRFPSRVGRHTEFFLPEQLPMHMNSKARRAKLLLLRTIDDGGHIDVFSVPSALSRRGTIQASERLVVESVDPDGSGAFTVRVPTGDYAGQLLTVPIDDVEAVWRQHNLRWAARVVGRLEQFVSFGGHRTLEYVPPNTVVVVPLDRTLEDVSKQVREVVKSLNRTLVVQQHARTEPSHADIAARAHRKLSTSVRHLRGVN